MADFKNRLSRRDKYLVLENTDSETGSVHRLSVPSSRRSSDTSSITLLRCDKCWLHRQSNSATKRCLECKLNLCDACALLENKRSRLSWFLQCWRYLFSSSSTSHTIVDLPPANERPTHWAHSYEANNVQHIPRVTRNSFRTNGSRSKSSKNVSEHNVLNDNSSMSNDDLSKHKFESVLTDNDQYRKDNRPPTNRPRRPIRHSQSFNEKRRRYRDTTDAPFRRSRSSEGLAHMYGKEEIDRLDQYNRNWEIGFQQEHNDRDNDHQRPRSYSNKMKGKDINIEFTDKEIKLTVNSDEKSRNKKKNANKCAVAKSKKNHQHDGPKPYTEQIFRNVPIWFEETDKSTSEGEHAKERRSSWGRSRPMSPNIKFMHDSSALGADSASRQNMSSSEFSQHHSTKFAEEERNNMYYHSDAPTPYIVEEPPDDCPICLEALPGNEARALTCCHVIHTECLIKYLKKTDLDFGVMCPLCNTKTVIKNYYAPRQLWYKELPVSSSV